jgi:hypothetical protein
MSAYYAFQISLLFLSPSVCILTWVYIPRTGHFASPPPVSACNLTYIFESYKERHHLTRRKTEVFFCSVQL